MSLLNGVSLQLIPKIRRWARSHHLTISPNCSWQCDQYPSGHVRGENHPGHHVFPNVTLLDVPQLFVQYACRCIRVVCATLLLRHMYADTTCFSFVHLFQVPRPWWVIMSDRLVGGCGSTLFASTLYDSICSRPSCLCWQRSRVFVAGNWANSFFFFLNGCPVFSFLWLNES